MKTEPGTSQKPTIVTLCGSTRFKQLFIDANARETMQGKIVLSVGCFGHADGIPLTEVQKAMLDELHLRQIDMATEVLVLDGGRPWCKYCAGWAIPDVYIKATCEECGGPCEERAYIGESTRRGIEYATSLGKLVRYWSKEKDQ